jgi:xanthine dehydrogenase accessory factor
VEIYKKIFQLKEEGKEFVVCTVISTKGSAPGKVGAKMIVMPDGAIFGTIGGGNIEFQAIEYCKILFINPTSISKKYNLETDLDMSCGGIMEIFFETMISKFSLYIFGAGHVGRAVAKYASDFNFKITFIDNRPDILKDFDGNFTFLNDEYDQAIEKLNFDERTFSLIVTHKHIFDESILLKLISVPFAYLGMIGSRNKVSGIRKKMIDAGTHDIELIDKIDMPIGIRINSVTPEEIAISIVAKLIDVKNNIINKNE